MPRFITTLAIVLLALVAPAKAQTQALPTTDLLLVLAVDASGSVNQARFELQRRGYHAISMSSPALGHRKKRRTDPMLPWRARQGSVLHITPAGGGA